MIEILADIHERNSDIAGKLRAKGWTVKESQLSIGDYLLGGTIGIERKTITDFKTSLIQGRLFQQLVRLRRSVDKPLLVVEGSTEAISGLHPNVIRGTVVSLAVKWSIPVLWSQNPVETAEIIHLIATQHTRVRLNWSPPSFPGRKNVPKAGLQQRLLNQIPQVGSKGAEVLLSYFGSLDRILTASEVELQQVKGMGQKKASLIYDVLHEPAAAYRISRFSRSIIFAKQKL